MPRRTARCQQTEIERAIRALIAVGARGAVELLQDGTIRIRVGEREPETGGNSEIDRPEPEIRL